MKTMLAVFFTLCALGQTWRGETEFTQDQKGNQTYDLYIFGNTKQISFFGRYFRAENSVNRGELGLGRTFLFDRNKSKSPRLVIAPYLGATSDKAALLAIVSVVNVARRTIVYIPDAKFYSGHKTLYQEASIGLTRHGEWQLRWETLDLWMLPVGGSKIPHLRAFNRVGIERRTGSSPYFHISPFYDTVNKQVGLYTGFRW